MTPIIIRRVSDGQIVKLPKQKRPRRCRQCHAPATYAEQERRPASVLRMDGTMRPFTETVLVYWCDDHSHLVLP